MIGAFDVVLGGVPRFDAEARWAARIVDRYARLLPYRTLTDTRGRRPTVADARGHAPVVLVQADPEAYLVPLAAGRLMESVGAGRSLVLPVTNEPWTEEARCAPPFAYHTPSLLEEAARYVAAQPAAVRPAASPRSPVYAVRRDALRGLPAGLALDEVPEEAHRGSGGVFIDPGAYLHRYGEMDGQPREDLVAMVPAGAAAALDVGCARGETARALKRAGVARVVGIEPDAADAAQAARVCDRVLATPLEEVREEFPGQFDAVLFGDVLEHLGDPSAALARVRPWLSERGVLVASVPNLGHWSIIADLLEGRFDYVPYSILSGTHVRFFTRRTLRDLFEASGYRIETIETVTFPASPEGAVKLQLLASIPGASEDLSAAEFLAVARPDGALSS
ncbi:MAG TPA: class I SAM-dependent methyltransferase [Thermoanaerobaculia bacterium]|nr:class I SAM-dependent methyltransferase [Thermoanaerobaculia bacterium]